MSVKKAREILMKAGFKVKSDIYDNDEEYRKVKEEIHELYEDFLDKISLDSLKQNRQLRKMADILRPHLIAIHDILLQDVPAVIEYYDLYYKDNDHEQVYAKEVPKEVAEKWLKRELSEGRPAKIRQSK